MFQVIDIPTIRCCFKFAVSILLETCKNFISDSKLQGKVE